MDNSIIFIASGLFLGWSLGANDAANLFGTAVSSKTIKFKNAAIVMSIFVILGAVVSGAGASHTLGTLGSINKLPGAFIVALSAAITVTLMTRRGLPVSTTQAIVGAIIGWNLFSGNPTNYDILIKMFGSWVFSPILSALFSIVLFLIVRRFLEKVHISLFKQYSIVRILLIIIGAFGAYSLGSNNIANVMGVFTNTELFSPIQVLGLTFNNTQILFFLGGIAISIGVFTYSEKVMTTVGKNIYEVSPITAMIAVASSSLVLFLFASARLKGFLTTLGLPSFPLVPVSISQSIVGAVIGVALAKGGRNINLRKLRNIAFGWILTPTFSIIIAYISLFFMQNVFMQKVF